MWAFVPSMGHGPEEARHRPWSVYSHVSRTYVEQGTVSVINLDPPWSLHTDAGDARVATASVPSGGPERAAGKTGRQHERGEDKAEETPSIVEQERKALERQLKEAERMREELQHQLNEAQALLHRAAQASTADAPQEAVAGDEERVIDELVRGVRTLHDLGWGEEAAGNQAEPEAATATDTQEKEASVHGQAAVSMVPQSSIASGLAACVAALRAMFFGKRRVVAPVGDDRRLPCVPLERDAGGQTSVAASEAETQQVFGDGVRLFAEAVHLLFVGAPTCLRSSASSPEGLEAERSLVNSDARHPLAAHSRSRFTGKDQVLDTQAARVVCSMPWSHVLISDALTRHIGGGWQAPAGPAASHSVSPSSSRSPSPSVESCRPSSIDARSTRGVAASFPAATMLGGVPAHLVASSGGGVRSGSVPQGQGVENGKRRGVISPPPGSPPRLVPSALPQPAVIGIPPPCLCGRVRACACVCVCVLDGGQRY